MLQVVNSTSHSVTFSWQPPMGSGMLTPLCQRCDVITGALTQYAHHAWSDASGSGDIWGPVEATGKSLNIT